MKIALAQLNPTVGDFAGNSAKILASAQRAAELGADLAVFSELCLCGYLPLDLIERPQFIDRNERELACLAKQLPIPSIVGYAARANGSTGKSAANAAALLADGKIEFVQHKMLLPTYDVFDESRYFQPATSQNVFPSAARIWASQSAKIFGTIRHSGPSPFTSATPSPNSLPRAPV